jgi:rhodanese-related sulfurtransferase
MPRIISPVEAKRLVDEENALLVDIREPEEFARKRIAGSRLEPLSVLPVLPPDPDRERPAVFYCQSGWRTGDNAPALEGRGFASTCSIDGGLDGWEKAGLPVVRRTAPLPMARQIQMAAGGMVFAFSLLSFSTPTFTWLTLFVGAGLMFAGYSGICLMAKLLARMPWNRTLLALAFVLMLPSVAPAHPGGRDAYGGHYDASTGEYHVHEGPLEGRKYKNQENMLKVLRQTKGGPAIIKRAEASGAQPQKTASTQKKQADTGDSALDILRKAMESLGKH